MSAAMVAVIKHDPKLAMIDTAPDDGSIEQAAESPALNVTAPPPLPPECPAVMPACW